MSILSLLVIIAVTFLPVFLWGYIFSYLHNDNFDRERFFIGIISGGFSVGTLVLFPKILGIEESTLTKLSIEFLTNERNILFLLLLLVSNTLISITTTWFLLWRKGRSLDVRAVISYVGMQFWLILIAFFVLFSIAQIFHTSGITPNNIAFLSSIFLGILSYSFASSLEESGKHISFLGSTRILLRQKLSEIILITLFIALGFVWIENILYLINTLSKQSLGWVVEVWILRSLFSLVIHIFAASVCTYFWFHASFHALGSLRYSLWFLSGFFLASILHALYNYAVAQNAILILFWFFALAYFLLTKWLYQERL